MPLALLGCFGLRPSLSKVVPLHSAGGHPKAVDGASTQHGNHNNSTLPQALDTAKQLLHLDPSQQHSPAAIVRCLDALMGRLLLTAQLDAACSKALTIQSAGELVQQLQQGCKRAGCSVEDVGSAISGMLSVLHRLWLQHSDGQQAMPDPGCSNGYAVPAINELLGLLHILLFQHVTLETPQTLARKWQQYSQLQGAFGWEATCLAVVLNPANKALLLYLLRGCHAPSAERKVTVTVSRQQPFWQALQQLQDQQVLPDYLHYSSMAAEAPARQLHDQQQQQQWVETRQQSKPAEAQGWACSQQQWCKVFPRFADASVAGGQQVEPGEGHGPRKEFFLLAGQDMVTGSEGPAGKRPALFVFNRAAGSYWINTGLVQSVELEGAFWFAGWLMAQALSNRAVLGIALAPLLFSKLLLFGKFQPSLQVLQAHDPEAASALLNVQKLKKQQFKDLLEMERLPPNTSQEEYIQSSVRSLLVDDVAWQFQALERGFTSVVSPETLLQCCMTPEDLAAAVCGSCTQDSCSIQQVFRVVVEDADADHDEDSGDDGGSVHAGGSGLVQPLLECLWRVVDGWPHELRIAFVKFVTGSDRLPLPGTEALRITLPFIALTDKERAALLGALPQAHTCENTLELPNYWEALLMREGQQHGKNPGGVGLRPEKRRALMMECERVLRDRLEMAIMHCTSYGLDEVDPAAAPAPAAPRQPLLQQHQQQVPAGIAFQPGEAMWRDTTGHQPSTSAAPFATGHQRQAAHAKPPTAVHSNSDACSSSDEDAILTIDLPASGRQPLGHAGPSSAADQHVQRQAAGHAAKTSRSVAPATTNHSMDDGEGDDSILTLEAASRQCQQRQPSDLMRPQQLRFGGQPLAQADLHNNALPGLTDADEALLSELMQQRR